MSKLVTKLCSFRRSHARLITSRKIEFTQSTHCVCSHNKYTTHVQLSLFRMDSEMESEATKFWLISFRRILSRNRFDPILRNVHFNKNVVHFDIFIGIVSGYYFYYSFQCINFRLKHRFLPKKHLVSVLNLMRIYCGRF